MKNILLIDDDRELRLNLSEILKDAGYLVEMAASGKEGLAKIACEDYDIALVDLMMPGMSGLEVLTESRKVKPGTKIIIMTAFATVKNAVDAIKQGASDYISKPFRIEELLSTIGRVLEEARFERDIRKLDLENTLTSLINSIRRSIIQMLTRRPGMRLMEITRELNIEDHSKVVFHLKILKESGIIIQNEEKMYSLTKQGHNTVDLLRILSNYLSSSG